MEGKNLLRLYENSNQNLFCLDENSWFWQNNFVGYTMTKWLTLVTPSIRSVGESGFLSVFPVSMRCSIQWKIPEINSTQSLKSNQWLFLSRLQPRISLVDSFHSVYGTRRLSVASDGFLALMILINWPAVERKIYFLQENVCSVTANVWIAALHLPCINCVVVLLC